ncbi:MAG: AMP-binding protein, partial [Prevotella sp.]|nr:AMP-binding protein [Prevotella sp.]
MDIKAGFIENVEQSIINNWDNPSLSDYQGDTLTYADVARRIAKLHIVMRETGVKEGDRIAVCGRSCSNWVVVFYAIVTYGCVAVPIQNEFRSEQIHNIVNHSDTKFLFIGDGVSRNINYDAMPGLAGTASLVKLRMINSRDERLSDVINHLDELYEARYPGGIKKEQVKYFHETNPDGLVLLNYTSGTTGFSKGVMIPYRSLWGNLYFTQTLLTKGVRPGDNLVSTLPPAHTFGMTCELLFGFVYGLHLHFLNRPTSPSIILQMCKQVRPTMLITVPLIMEKIMRKTVFPRLAERKVRRLLRLPIVKRCVKRRIARYLNEELGGNIYQVFTGGASMNPDIERFLIDIGFPITSGYGTTETSPMITFSDRDDHLLGSCGTVVPCMEMKIAGSEDGRGSGEVLCRGMNVMLGYYKDPDGTATVLQDDGWFHTGDLGRISDDGHLFLLGRIKNILLGANGLNIYPEEIEAKLNSLPMVA